MRSSRTPTAPRTHNRFGDRSFAVAGPHLWNSLPISMWQISSYGQFRRYLKIIYLGFEKSQPTVTHDFLCYINGLTYLQVCNVLNWNFICFMTGIGYTMIGINMMVSTYYNVILALTILYLAASFTSHLPWTDCDNWWNRACSSQHCSNYHILIPIRFNVL